MPNAVGPALLVVAIAATLAIALVVRHRDGRFRGAGNAPSPRPDEPAVTTSPTEQVVDAVRLGIELGEQLTFLQLSSAFCSPCRATRVLLADVAGSTPGVAHVEIDAESHLDLVRELDVRRTPTVLVLDERGGVLSRASGLPTREQVLAVLRAAGV